MKLFAPEIPRYTDSEAYTPNDTAWLWVTSFCMLAFILCIALSVAPLQRAVGIPLLSQLPISKALTTIGAWFPKDFHMLQDRRRSIITTANGEFLLLIALMFVLYRVCYYYIRYKVTIEIGYIYVLAGIGVVVIATGLIFLFTPALPSQDIFVYADYGRTIVAHHSNPYFVPPLQSSPTDILTRLDGWSSVINAYGPLWLYICSLFSLLLGDDPVRYIFAFRLLGLVTHILNIVLILAILRSMGQSRRTLVTAAFLYGCNPLVLVESCLNAHNDACMITFILLGIWLSLRAEKRNIARLKLYILPLLALTMAVLIKFTCTPLVLLFLCLLACKALAQTRSVSVPQRWLPVLFKVCIASMVCGLTILLFYLPFWIGHSISAIVRSFSLAPSSYGSQNSMMRVFFEWVKLYGLPPHNSWLYRPVYSLAHRIMWDRINAILLIVILSIGAVLLWRAPTTRSMVFAALVVFEPVLIVTPWFYSWYVLWIVALAVLLLTENIPGKSKAIILFAFVFSASAFFTYIMPYYLQAVDGWLGTRYLLTAGSPVFVLLSFIVVYGVRRIKTMGMRRGEQKV